MDHTDDSHGTGGLEERDPHSPPGCRGGGTRWRWRCGSPSCRVRARVKTRARHCRWSGGPLRRAAWALQPSSLCSSGLLAAPASPRTARSARCTLPALRKAAASQGAGQQRR